ncbi:2'-5' RNA ligase family protein [Amycolatopsis sp.]|uniref:2'-5' RNA ligase family protein n=1 Tax=Amycolatopsis sp. TaxID=37632 RepID=UPI002BB66B08|nr:2'-5' RNA ligase family protein [Amycolatopsis sp.]HVV11463.1 2'-5' RNA ligase family protein [Amycolatopsis sp.]
MLLPDAEPLLDAVRRVAPVRPLPAHVSLLYPGPPVFEDVALPGEVDLAEIIVGDGGFVGVAVPALEPAAATLRSRYPELVPYGGRFGETPPAHLTLVMGVDDAVSQAVQRIAAEALPLRSRVDGPHFVQRTGHGWRPA